MVLFHVQAPDGVAVKAIVGVPEIAVTFTVVLPPITKSGSGSGVNVRVFAVSGDALGSVCVVEVSESGLSPARLVASTRTVYEAPAVRESKVIVVDVVSVAVSGEDFDISRK